MFVKLWVLRDIGMSASLFIGSWSFAAMLLNQTKGICTHFLGKEKEINLNIVKAASMLVGSLMTIPFLAHVLSLLFCLSISFWTNIRLACSDGHEEITSLCKTSILGLPDELLENLVLYCISSPTKGFICIVRVCSPNHWFTSLLPVLHLFLGVACAFLNIDQSNTFYGPYPPCCQLAISSE